MSRRFIEAKAEAMVTIVFSAGAELLDLETAQKHKLKKRLILQLRMIAKGADHLYRPEKKS